MFAGFYVGELYKRKKKVMQSSKAASDIRHATRQTPCDARYTSLGECPEKESVL